MLCCLKNLNRLVLRPVMAQTSLIHTTPDNAAARKGTREKARKKKVKVEVKKIGFIPHNQREINKVNLVKANKHVDDSWKAIPLDNAYVGRYYRWRVYSILDAINCHRQTHHPTMYNMPNAPLNVEIELNMVGEKVTRFVDNFHRMANVPHRFDHGEDRKIIVFVKGQEFVKSARDAGASIIGGVEIIKDIQNGDIQLADYQYVVAHPNILPDLVPLRGLMKKKFPNPKSGTLGADLPEMVKKFCDGIQYSAIKDENQQNFGVIKTSIGMLNMDEQHLENNLIALIKDVDSIRPRRSGKFITRVLLKCPPSGEQFKINPFLYISEESNKSSGKQLSEAVDDETAEELVEKENVAAN